MTTATVQRTLPTLDPSARRGRQAGLISESVGTLAVLLLPGLIGDAYLLRLAQDVAILATLGLGLTLIFGWTGQISLGQAAFYAIGGYTAAILQTRLGWPAPLTWLAAIAFGAALAYVISLPLLRIHGHFLALGTLAVGVIVQTLLVQLVPLTGGHDGIVLPGVVALGPWLQARFPYVVMAVFVLAYWLVRNLTRRSVGRALLALRDDPAGAAALGIPLTRYKTAVFAIGGGLSAAAGVLYAHHTQVVTPDVFGFDASIQVLLVVVIGGMTSRFGAVIGAAIVVLLPEYLQFLDDAKNLIFGLLVLSLLLALPGGIVGGLRSTVTAVRRAGRRGDGQR
jgi:branched-chain amino acid transport system permease protein